VTPHRHNLSEVSICLPRGITKMDLTSRAAAPHFFDSPGKTVASCRHLPAARIAREEFHRLMSSQ
ncbi:MAG: hypothetical protein UHN88_04415, partial [Eubacterium sp.]|nr:hypothetical protein [Eubacterium sp.]